MNHSRALSYDDVTLIPQYSEIESREHPDTTVTLGGLKLSAPIISSNMDTVTEDEMAIAMWKTGGVGALHRFMSIDDNLAMYSKVKTSSADCFVSVGVNDWDDRMTSLYNVGARYVIIDVAHGHTKMMRDAIMGLRKKFGYDIYIMAGNVATGEAAVDLARWGANAVKVGVGGGGVCKTRVVTGHGVPMFTSVMECADALEKSEFVVDLIADGSIKASGDIAKAIVAGADAVMIGGLLGRCSEAPGERLAGGTKIVRGMASHAAQVDRGATTLPAEEGVEATVKITGPVSKTMDALVRGLKSGMSYSGAYNLTRLRVSGKWREQTQIGHFEGTPHILVNK